MKMKKLLLITALLSVGAKAFGATCTLEDITAKVAEDPKGVDAMRTIRFASEILAADKGVPATPDAIAKQVAEITEGVLPKAVTDTLAAEGGGTVLEASGFNGVGTLLLNADGTPIPAGLRANLRASGKAMLESMPNYSGALDRSTGINAAVDADSAAEARAATSYEVAAATGDPSYAPSAPGEEPENSPYDEAV